MEKGADHNYNQNRDHETKHNGLKGDVIGLDGIFTSCPLESFYKYSANKCSASYVSPGAINDKTSFLVKMNGLIGVSIPKETDKNKNSAFFNNKARYDQVDEKYKKYIMSQKKPDDIGVSIIQATALSALDRSLQLLNSKNKTDIKNFLSEMNESLGGGEHISKGGILPKNLLLNMIYKTGITSYDQETLTKAITCKKGELKELYDKIKQHNNVYINNVGDNVLKDHFNKIQNNSKKLLKQ